MKIKERLEQEVDIEVKRYIIIYTSRTSKNWFMKKDTSMDEYFVYEKRVFSLRKVHSYYNSKPVYCVFLDFNFSVEFELQSDIEKKIKEMEQEQNVEGLKFYGYSVDQEFRMENDKLVERAYTPADMNTYLDSQTARTVFDDKRKFRFIDVISYLLVIGVAVLITWIVSYGILMGY